MVRRRGRIRTCNIRFQRPSCCQIAPPAYMPVCASTHSLDATRRPGCDGHRPPLRPPANACCATTGWMPRGPATWVRCPSCPSRPTGGVPCVPARDSNLDLHPQRAACCHYTNRPLTPNQTGCKAGMPDSISPAAPRYGVRKLRFKRTVRWVTNPAVKPGRALPSIP